jgi:hypothetical protein
MKLNQSIWINHEKDTKMKDKLLFSFCVFRVFRGLPLMKRQNGIVSIFDQTGRFLAGGGARVKLH